MPVNNNKLFNNSFKLVIKIDFLVILKYNLETFKLKEKPMTYLLPLNRNNIETRPEVFANISDQAFSDSTISDIKKWTLSVKDHKTERVSNIAIAIFSCTAMVCLPKIAAFGSVAIVAFVYYKLAKMIGNKEKALALAMRNQRIIKFLSVIGKNWGRSFIDNFPCDICPLNQLAFFLRKTL